MLECHQKLYKLSLFGLLFFNCTCLIYCFSNINDDSVAPRPGWIDPFDMLGEARHTPDNVFVQSDVENLATINRLKKCETYLRRFVNLFLQAIELKDPTPADSLKFVKLEFVINQKQLNVLNQFGREVNSAASVESVSDVLANIFSQNPKNLDQHYSSFDRIMKWLQAISQKLANSPEWTVVSSITVMMFVTLWLICIRHSYRFAVFTLLLAIFLAGFGFNWIRMYEEKEVEKYYNQIKHGGNVPKHCTEKSLVWYEHMFYRMFGDDCQQFYKTRDVRTMVQISPTDVFVETISSMIVKPAAKIGKAYGSFVTNVIDAVPWWLQPIAMPLSFILPVFFSFGVILVLFSYSLKLSLTGFHIFPSHGNPSIQRSRDHHYIEDMSHKMHSDDKSPLFMVNWHGLKTLMKNVALVDKDSHDEKDAGLDSNIDNETTVKKENENPVQVESLAKLPILLDKHDEPRKRRPRSIHTVAEEISLAGGSEENKNPNNDCLDTDLPSGGERHSSEDVKNYKTKYS